MSKGGRLMHENCFFSRKRCIAIKNDFLADEQMHIDKRQDSTCTLSMSLVLNKSNISSEKIVLLNNNTKVSLVLNAFDCAGIRAQV